MAQRKTLTEQQVAVLRWIGDGCPAGVMEGTFHRISAGALRNRGLVKTSGRGPTWSAKIKTAGRDYLREVDGPNPPLPRQANVSVTQQFVDDIIAAGGAQRFPQSDRWDLERKARFATRHRKVPDGTRLEVAYVGDEVEIRLIDDEAATAELLPVAVPEKIGRYHPAARAFRDRREHHEVSREQLQRATRIVHAIAVEAERRGWAATGQPGCLQLIAQDVQFSIRLREDGVHPRGSWGRNVGHYRGVDPTSNFYRDRTLTGPYDAGAGGQLRLELLCENDWIFRGRQSRWSDRQSWTLEERLPHLFREIEERIVEAKRVAEERRIAAEERAEAERREAEERERRWHVLMEQARQRLVETHRAPHLHAQAEAWEQAERLRRYCDALAEAYGGDNPRTAEWIAWAREYAARLDPLAAPPVMPEPPEETREALQQHLPNGWSVYGPEHGYRPRRYSSFW